MKNHGLFSTLFIEALKKEISTDDAAAGRMKTLAQTWQTRKTDTLDGLWNSFMQKAMSYLEFVPGGAEAPGAYPLFEDWDFSRRAALLYLVGPSEDMDAQDVHHFYPARLLILLRRYNLNWGILSDGSRWRLYATKSSRPYEDYVELDLAGVLESDDEVEYGLFERFFHRNAFIAEQEADQQAEKSAGVYRCRLDRDREASEKVLDQKVKAPMLEQVSETLEYLCNGFIFDTRKTGEDYTEAERADIFESAVKLLYRCLFLFYAEARRLLPSDPEKALVYQEHSIQSLCREARKFQWGSRKDHEAYDLWNHLKGLVAAVNDGDPEYGIMGYNGGLFDDEEEPFLGEHRLRNDFLSRALYLLAYVAPASGEPGEEYPIPYEDLEVRHLGELYENILEFTVRLAYADRLRRRTKKGVEILLADRDHQQPGDTLIKKGSVFFGESALERKQTGSFYTPDPPVRFLNEKTVIKPLRNTFETQFRSRFDEFLAQARTAHDTGERQGAIRSATALVERFVREVVLHFKVCDLSMGSGHFLVNAVNQMAGLVVDLFAEIPETDAESEGMTLNDFRRQITRHCLYGVDLKPLAVNLAKLSLWLNCFAVHHRLTFLDHHLRCGNSLIGILDIKQLARIPERKRDKKKNRQQMDLFDLKDLSETLTAAAQDVSRIKGLDEDDTDAQKQALDSAEEQAARLRPLADLFTAYLMDGDIHPDDYETLFQCLAEGRPPDNPLRPKLTEIEARTVDYQQRHRFFHWPLEFPDVFGPEAPGGFSATVGNPPWDVLQPNTQEFFQAYDPSFRRYKKQEAVKIAKKLKSEYPEIAQKWSDYEHSFKQASSYCKQTEAYKCLQKGKIDLYKAFLERFFRILKRGGRMGIVVPSGVYTDQGCMPLREMFFSKSKVDFMYCFENRWPTVFNAVDGRFKFVLFGTEKGEETDEFKCAFMEHDPERLPLIDRDALKMSEEQVRKFSPDTLSVMEFKSQRDIDITAKIYGDWPLLGDKLDDTWNVQFRQELNMTSDSHLFKTTPTDCPLYEGKMIWLFDSDFDEPRYWLDREEVEEALRENAWEGNHYRVGYRDIAASTNERTLIASILPPTWHGHTMASIQPYHSSKAKHAPKEAEKCWLASVMSSFCIDYLIRQKVTNHMSFFYMRTLPVPPDFGLILPKFINPVLARAIRLLCSSGLFALLWGKVFIADWQSPDFWYPPSAPIDTYGPADEQVIRKRLRDEAPTLTPEWGPHCGVHDRLPDRRDTGDRAQLRAEIDAYVAHLYGLSRDDFAYILDTFPVLKKKEEKAFGEFMSKRKCLEEYDRIGKILNAK